MIYIFIWGIGALFSCGLYSRRVENRAVPEMGKVLSYCALVLFWPHYLGYTARGLL